MFKNCLLYTSDAADDTPCVDLGGRRIIKIKINLIILKNPENSFTAQRSITLGFKKKPNFLRFIPNKILKNLLSQALDLIAKRVDKKLLLKLSNVTQN